MKKTLEVWLVRKWKLENERKWKFCLRKREKVSENVNQLNWLHINYTHIIIVDIMEWYSPNAVIIFSKKRRKFQTIHFKIIDDLVSKSSHLPLEVQKKGKKREDEQQTKDINNDTNNQLNHPKKIELQKH